MVKLLVALISLFTSSPANLEPMNNVVPPSMNISNIHAIYCLSEGMIYQGTGFLIAPGVIATANHVAEDTVCRDVTADVPLVTYKTDRRHDFALMTGAEKAVGDYTKYRCDHPVKGDYYISYGWSSVGLPDFFNPIIRNNPILAKKSFNNNPNAIPGFLDSSGMRIYQGAIASGMSGGPVADVFGNVIAINNAGNDKETLLFDLADTGLCTGKWDAKD